MAGRRVVIVGNGVAGTTAAETVRRLDPSARVTLLGDEPYPLYNRVALPRVLQGRLPAERTVMRTVKQHEERGIDLRLATRAAGVDWDRRAVLLATGEALPWDALVIATGGTPRRFALDARPRGAAEGESGRFALPFQTLDDTRRLVAAAEGARTAARGSGAVVIGGSFIGYELADGFSQRGLAVDWRMRGPRFLHRILDEEQGAIVARLAEAQGVAVRAGREPATGAADREALERGTEPPPLVAAGVGLQLQSGWLSPSPLRLMPDGSILVDDHLRTGVEGVYAAGDIACCHDPLLGRPHRMGTWDNALAHGRLAAENLCGHARPFREIPTYSSPLFGSTIAVIGVTPQEEPELERATVTDAARGTSRTLFLMKGVVVGGVMIGNVRGRRRLIEAIGERRKVVGSAARELLSLD